MNVTGRLCSIVYNCKGYNPAVGRVSMAFTDYVTFLRYVNLLVAVLSIAGLFIKILTWKGEIQGVLIGFTTTEVY